MWSNKLIWLKVVFKLIYINIYQGLPSFCWKLWSVWRRKKLFEEKENSEMQYECFKCINVFHHYFRCSCHALVLVCVSFSPCFKVFGVVSWAGQAVGLFSAGLPQACIALGSLPSPAHLRAETALLHRTECGRGPPCLQVDQRTLQSPRPDRLE